MGHRCSRKGKMWIEFSRNCLFVFFTHLPHGFLAFFLLICRSALSMIVISPESCTAKFSPIWSFSLNNAHSTFSTSKYFSTQLHQPVFPVDRLYVPLANLGAWIFVIFKSLLHLESILCKKQHLNPVLYFPTHFSKGSPWNLKPLNITIYFLFWMESQCCTHQIRLTCRATVRLC